MLYRILLCMLLSASLVQAATSESGPPKVVLNPSGTGAGATGELKFKELVANGQNAVGFKAPDTISADKIWTLPGGDGTSGQVLQTNGSGVLSWATPSAGGPSDGDKGDITISGSGATYTIDALAVTFAKFQNIATDRLVGRDTASSGSVEEISVGGGLEFTGSAGIQRSALTGDVTASAGSNSTTIANNAVTTAKILDSNVTTSKIADSNVTTVKIADSNVTTAKIADANVTTAKIADSSISYAKLAAELKYQAHRRNIIHNGEFRVDQPRNGSVYSSQGPIVDRWQMAVGGSVTLAIDASRSTTVPSSSSFENSLKIDVTSAESTISAGDYFVVHQRIRGSDASKLKNKSFTFSFWVSSPKTGIHCVFFRNGGTSNASTMAADRSYVAEYTVSAANTWEQKSITVTSVLPTGGGTWNFLNGIGLEVGWCLFGGSTYQTTAGAWQTGNYFCTSSQVNVCDNTANDFYVTGVQLEQGPISTPFEHQSTTDLMDDCYTHCWVPGYSLAGYTTGAFQPSPGFTGLTNGTTDAVFQVMPPVPMRAQPTVSATGSEWIVVDSISNPTPTGFNVTNFSYDSFRLNAPGTYTSARVCFLVADATGGRKMIFRCEP